MRTPDRLRVPQAAGSQTVATRQVAATRVRGMTTTNDTTTPAASGGFNHLALVTADLERLEEFYCGVLGGQAVEVPAPPGSGRATAIRFGERSALVLMEVAESEHATGQGDSLQRGHLDHVGFDVPTAAALEAIRERLLARGASDGRIHDYGSLVTVHFVDPDGMSSEVCWLRDPELRDLHPPTTAEGSLHDETVTA
jgi:catechol 2,3-dioxygenase-like lactoylglutathione lyase family enzyme